MNRYVLRRRRWIVPAGVVVALLTGLVAPDVARAEDDPPGTVVLASSVATDIALTSGGVSWRDESSPHAVRFRPLQTSRDLETPRPDILTAGETSVVADASVGPNLDMSALRTGYNTAPEGNDEQTYVVTDGTKSTTIHDAARGSRTSLSGTRIAYLGKSGHQFVLDLRTHRTTDMTATLGASRDHAAVWGNYYAFSKPDGSVWRKDLTSTAPAAQVAPKSAYSFDPSPPFLRTNVFMWGDWVAYTQEVWTDVSYTYPGFRNMRTGAPATKLSPHDSANDLVVGASAGGAEVWDNDSQKYKLLRWDDGSLAATLPTSHGLDENFPTRVTPPAVDGSVVAWIGTDHRPRVAPLGVEVANKPRALGTGVAASTLPTGGDWKIEVPTSAVLLSCGVSFELQGVSEPADISVGCDSDAMARGEVVADWDGKQNDGRPAPPGYYFWTASAQVKDGPLLAADGGIQCVCNPVTVVAPSLFHPLTPSRLLDTRVRVGGTRVAGHGTLALQVGGRGGVPASGVAAVALSVTAVRPAAPGWLVAYPNGTPRPATSNLNFAAGQTVANLVTAPVGGDGKIALYNGSAAATDLVADVDGYYAMTPSGTPGAFVSTRASRLLDTRSGLGAPAAAPRYGTLAFDVANNGPVPLDGVSAVALNVTVSGSSSPGYLTVYDGDAARPLLHTMSFGAGQSVANLVVVPVDKFGQVRIYNGSPGTAQVTADVAGYYLSGTPTESGAFVATAPTRLLDTGSSLGARGTVPLQVAGRGLVPASAIAAMMNVTATSPNASGYVTGYADGTSRPLATNLTFARGPATSDLVVSAIGRDGKVDLYNGSTGTTRLIADVSGYFRA